MNVRDMFAGFALAVAASSAFAQEATQQKLFDELAQQVEFSTNGSDSRAGIPDPLLPAVSSYAECAIRSAGGSITKYGTDKNQQPDIGRACIAERAKARTRSAEVLQQAGLTDPTLRQTLINRTFLVIDLNANAVREIAGATGR